MHFALGILGLTIFQLMGHSQQTCDNKFHDLEIDTIIENVEVETFWCLEEEKPKSSPFELLCEPKEGNVECQNILYKPLNRLIPFGNFFFALENKRSRSDSFKPIHWNTFHVKNLLEKKSSSILIQAIRIFPPSDYEATALLECLIDEAPTSEASKLISYLSTRTKDPYAYRSFLIMLQKYPNSLEKQQIFWPFFLNNTNLLDEAFLLSNADKLNELIKDPGKAQLFLNLALHIQQQRVECDFVSLIPALTLIALKTLTSNVTEDFYLSLLLRLNLIEEKNFRDKYLHLIEAKPKEFPITVNAILGPCRSMNLCQYGFLQKIVPFLNPNQCQKISQSIETVEDVFFLREVILLMPNANNYQYLIDSIRKIELFDDLRPNFPLDAQGQVLKARLSEALIKACARLNQEKFQKDFEAISSE